MPTFSQTVDVLKQIVKILSDSRDFGSDFITAQAALGGLTNTAGGDFKLLTNNRIQEYRAIINSLINGNSVNRRLTPVLRMFGEALDSPQTSNAELLRVITEYMIENSISIKSRNLTFGSITAGGSNAGNGLLYRCLKDKYNLEIQNCFVDDKTFTCISDRNSGSESGEEVFRVETSYLGQDNLNRESLGSTTNLIATTYRGSKTFVGNPSFNQFTGTEANPTDITNWTVDDDIAHLELDSTNFYRDFIPDVENGTARSLVFKDDDKISQNLTNRRGNFVRTNPYFISVAYFADTSVSAGDLILTLGNSSVQADLTVNKNQWNRLTIALDEDAWFDNFNDIPLELSIEVDNLAGGNVRVDDLIIAPMTLFDGLYWIILGGNVPFEIEDKFTITGDSESGTAKIQREIWRGFNSYLPHDSSPTITDPT